MKSDNFEDFEDLRYYLLGHLDKVSHINELKRIIYRLITQSPEVHKLLAKLDNQELKACLGLEISIGFVPKEQLEQGDEAGDTDFSATDIAFLHSIGVDA